jgi:hypothetical protein
MLAMAPGINAKEIGMASLASSKAAAALGACGGMPRLAV